LGTLNILILKRIEKRESERVREESVGGRNKDFSRDSSMSV
jgi:hypothetical protein